ncbi:MAG TPA: hypothetical protein IAC03_06560 [Candidatus Coprenecus pullistercoris]|nr:hypothetical protein [Candidatus Coprenecus pullistercoris]
MKKTALKLWMTAGCAALALMAVASCEEDRTGGTPVFEPAYEGAVYALPEGGEYNIVYRLENPVSGGTVSASPAGGCDWISDINTLVADTVFFTVAPNVYPYERQTTMTLVYNYSGADPIVFTVNVVQTEAKEGSTYPDAFTIEVPENDITATTARVITTCAYEDLTWFGNIASQVEVDQLLGGDKSDVEAGKSYINQYLQYLAEIYSMPLTTILPDLLFEGAIEDDFTFEGLSPETTFHPYAVGIDMEGTVLTSVYWGPEFTTKKPELVDVTFEVTVTPGVQNATISVHPSDPSVYYLATVMDNSFYEAGYTDQEIMMELIYQAQYAYNGDQDITIGGMLPSTEYIAVVFGIDIDQLVYITDMTKKTFTTNVSQQTDAAVTASMANYWSIEGLAGYNASYAFPTTNGALLGALDFEFNESATSLYWNVFQGDMTDYSADQLENFVLNYNPSLSYKGDPAEILFMDYGEFTAVVLPMDASGNYGTATAYLLSLTEESVSTDYTLFDEYYQALMNAQQSFAVPAKVSRPAAAEQKEVVTLSESSSLRIYR